MDMKLDFGDFGGHIPTNFQKGGMKELVDRRCKGKATIGSLGFATLNAIVHPVQREAQVAHQQGLAW